MVDFADALRLDKFTGVHFKRWQVKATLWLTALKVFTVSNGKPEGAMSDEDQRKFEEANTLFVGCILGVLADRLCDVYMHIKDGKELWDALNAKFGATDAGSELYIMKSLWLGALLQSYHPHGETLPQLSNTRDKRCQLKD